MSIPNVPPRRLLVGKVLLLATPLLFVVVLVAFVIAPRVYTASAMMEYHPAVSTPRLSVLAEAWQLVPHDRSMSLSETRGQANVLRLSVFSGDPSWAAKHANELAEMAKESATRIKSGAFRITSLAEIPSDPSRPLIAKYVGWTLYLAIPFALVGAILFFSGREIQSFQLHRL